MSILTREEEREPCRERGERKRRESEGVHGGRGERTMEMGRRWGSHLSPSLP
jgi:hypothetical protein